MEVRVKYNAEHSKAICEITGEESFALIKLYDIHGQETVWMSESALKRALMQLGLSTSWKPSQAAEVPKRELLVEIQPKLEKQDVQSPLEKLEVEEKDEEESNPYLAQRLASTEEVLPKGPIKPYVSPLKSDLDLLDASLKQVMLSPRENSKGVEDSRLDGEQIKEVIARFAGRFPEPYAMLPVFKKYLPGFKKQDIDYFLSFLEKERRLIMKDMDDNE